jgi:hypothetical protein
MNDNRSFFHFQARVGGVLLAWGAASMGVGLAALWSRNQRVRHAGIQAIGWGAVDAAIGWLGRRGAQRKIEAHAGDVATEARRFRVIVLVNTLLDVGYVAGGWQLMRTARGRDDRAGAGLGILVQGLFLLMFDAILAWLAGRWAKPGD